MVAATAAAGGFALGRDDTAEATNVRPREVPFHGRHQAGIVTPAQDRLHFAAFDVTASSRDDLVALLRAWTAAAARMVRGEGAGKYGPVGGPYQGPPDDTGEALGLPPSALTITFGFGPTLFTATDGADRFGLAERRPEGLIDLPHFPADNLDPARSGGDLCVQACADDPQVAVHAVRNLARIAFGSAAVRWSQLGFGRTSSTSTEQVTARNLMGFKDGTANLKAEDPSLLAEHVWVADGDDPAAPWLVDGTFLVARRINMHIETWDRTSLQEQENIIGRDKGEGAPLSGGDEFTPLDFDAEGAAGPLIPLDAHVRLAHPTENHGCPAPAAGLQLHRRHGRPGAPRRRPLLPGLRSRPGHPVRPDAEPPGPGRPADGVPAAHRVGAVRRPARRRERVELRRRDALRLRGRRHDQPARADSFVCERIV